MVCANRRYRILQTELARAGMAKSAPKALSLTDLTRSAIDWGGHWSEDSVCRLAARISTVNSPERSAARLPSGVPAWSRR